MTTSKDSIEESYEEALDALVNGPLHQARTKEALAKTAARRKNTIQDMKTYMKRISLLDDAFPKSLSIVHITGTKGKGSTSALCESILREHYGLRTGLFTSPHLVDIRERIRIGGQPVSKEVFAKTYWEVRKRLEKYRGQSEEDEDPDLPHLPGYFRMLTLMAFFTFAHYEPKLDVIILEVGMGGRFDATNILDMDGRNAVCGVTLLDLDHTRVLGDTLEQIAWEKGGIFQAIKGQSDYDESTQQPTTDATLFIIDSNTKSVISAFEKCAKEESNGRTLKIVGECTKAVPDTVTIGLPGDHQRINAELAVALCEAVTKSLSSIDSKKRKNTDTLYQALANASWPGRCQTVSYPAAKIPTNLRLDGSHTPISLKAGYDWFCSVSKADNTKRYLIFNCSHERNPVELLSLLLPSSDATFEKAFFCRSDFARPSAVTKANAEDLLKDGGIAVREELLPDSSSDTPVTWQVTLEAIWKHLEAESKVSTKAATVVNLTVGEALEQIKEVSADDDSCQLEVFVVGSLYLAGSTLNAIGWREPEAEGGLKLN